MLELDGLGVNTSRTFVVPNPGGKARSAVDNNARLAFYDVSDETLHASSALLRSASSLLNMIYQVRTLVHNSDPFQLRNHLIEEIKKFERNAKSNSISAETIEAARYCLCTVIDETAAQTPWGGGGIWAKYSLLVTFHNETWGGEKFFQILARITQAPAVHRELIELMFFCISLGFEGRYKIINNGQAQLELLRLKLSEILSELKEDREKYLSPHWRGITKPRPPIWSLLPVWMSALFCSLIAVSIFTILAFKLSDESDRVFAKILQAPVPVMREKMPPAHIEGKVTALLQDEISKNLVSVKEVPGVASVNLLGDGLFSPGSVFLNPVYVPVIEKISKAIDEFGKGAIVSGHTDNIPIRTARFLSNWHLSVERAQAVAVELEAYGITPNLLKVQGLGEAEPLASNDNKDGRALNRRVEVKILLNSAQ